MCKIPWCWLRGKRHSFTKKCIVPSLFEFMPVFWPGVDDFFKFWPCTFSILLIPPWKRTWPFVLTKLNSPHPRRLCAKLGWNWSSYSWKTFWISLMIILKFRYHLPLEKDVALHLELNFFYPSYPRMLCAMFGWNCPDGFREEVKHVKSL